MDDSSQHETEENNGKDALEIEGLEADGLEVDGLEVDGLGIEDLEVDGLEVDELEIDELDVEALEDDGLEDDGLEADGVEVEASEIEASESDDVGSDEPPQFKEPLITEEELTLFDATLKRYSEKKPYRQVGRVVEITGMNIKAKLPYAQLGQLCEAVDPVSKNRYKMEVIGFEEDLSILTSLSDLSGLTNRAYIRLMEQSTDLEVGSHMIGNVYNGLGEVMQSWKGASESPGNADISSDMERTPIYRDSPDPLEREVISKPLSLGVKAIDSLLTCGEGQRMGIFAGAGVGKTTLLTMLAKNAEVDVNVIALIGERGRELNEFLTRELDESILRKSVVIVSTSDRPPMERAKAAFIATTVSEYFRSKGNRVLLLMDSVTRFARAYREIGLAAGEPPTRRGFPPSVFAQLAKLLERTGVDKHGSITAFYTVLVEGDDMSDPVADEVRSILDGHIILSRKIAEQNRYPAIDVLQSASRVMNSVVDKSHLAAAGEFKKLLAKYHDIELLVNLGEYKRGNDKDGDKALDKISSMIEHLNQRFGDRCTLNDSVKTIQSIVR